MGTKTVTDAPLLPPLQPWRYVSTLQKLASFWRMPIIFCRLTSNWRGTAGGPTIKVAGQASVDWRTLPLPVYARIFTAQVRRGNSCRD